MKTTTSFSIYDKPAVQRELDRQRAELRERGIEPYRFIGAAYVPKEFHRIHADQEWLSWVFLR